MYFAYSTGEPDRAASWPYPAGRAAAGPREGLVGHADQIRQRAGGPLSPASVGQARRLLHNAMERAVALEIITRNVVRPVKAPRGQKAEIEILDDSQVDNILTALAGHELYPLAAFALGTGCRRGEV